MKPFHLESNMTTMRGVFYPTGYMFLMFPTEQGARDAEKLLSDDGFNGEEVSLLTPEQIRSEIAATAGGEEALPSAGTEADTVRRYVELAGEGHHALMVHAPSANQSDRVLRVLKDAGISYGQKYRHLVIEDIET
jgi:hypothetical protein